MMMPGRWWTVRALGTGLCLVSAAAVLAGPFMPDRGAVPDRVRAARGLERARVQVAQISGALEEEGVTREKITRLWRTRLRAEGIAIAEAGEEAPTVVLSLKILPHDRHEDVVAYGLFMTLDQRVHVERLDTTMVIPTYVNNLAGVTDRNDLGDEIEQASAFMARKFLTHVRLTDDDG